MRSCGSSAHGFSAWRKSEGCYLYHVCRECGIARRGGGRHGRFKNHRAMSTGKNLYPGDSWLSPVLCASGKSNPIWRKHGDEGFGQEAITVVNQSVLSQFSGAMGLVWSNDWMFRHGTEKSPSRGQTHRGNHQHRSRMVWMKAGQEAGEPVADRLTSRYCWRFGSNHASRLSRCAACGQQPAARTRITNRARLGISGPQFIRHLLGHFVAEMSAGLHLTSRSWAHGSRVSVRLHSCDNLLDRRSANCLPRGWEMGFYQIGFVR
jgi:hypothetical protein